MEIKIPKYLSSKVFYESVIKDINRKLQVYSDERILLDFTETCKIYATVIPDLVVLGTYLREKTGYMPVIRLGEDLKAGSLKKYLNGIGFYSASANKYSFENNPYGGMYGTEMDPVNTTELFEYVELETYDGNKKKKDEILEQYKRKVYFKMRPFINKYLNLEAFMGEGNEDEDYGIEVNIVSSFIYHMAENSFLHGKSSSAVTIQANYKDKKLYISISDMGKGFMQAWIDDKVENATDEKESDVYDVLGREPRSEMEGIMLGIYKRKKSKYHGLYNIVERVLKLDGIIRIHSNTTQIILTSRQRDLFLNEELPKRLPNMEMNRRENVIFAGAHIEVELPLTKEEKR